MTTGVQARAEEERHRTGAEARTPSAPALTAHRTMCRRVDPRASRVPSAAWRPPGHTPGCCGGRRTRSAAADDDPVLLRDAPPAVRHSGSQRNNRDVRDGWRRHNDVLEVIALNRASRMGVVTGLCATEDQIARFFCVRSHRFSRFSSRSRATGAEGGSVRACRRT